ncbi:hypothetical protein ACFL4T_04315 [candidate division KSB1 bacterium]
MNKQIVKILFACFTVFVFCSENGLNNDRNKSAVNALVVGSVEIQSLVTGIDGTATGEIIKLNDLDSILVKLGYDDIPVEWCYTEDGQFSFYIEKFDKDWHWLDADFCWGVHKKSSITNHMGDDMNTASYFEKIILPPDNEGTSRFKPYIGPYPNPFTGSTKFRYALTDTMHEVKMRIWSYRDKKFAEFTKLDSLPGMYEVDWDGKDTEGIDCPPGVYIAYFECRDFRNYGHSFYQTVVKE